RSRTVIRYWNVGSAARGVTPPETPPGRQVPKGAGGVVAGAVPALPAAPQPAPVAFPPPLPSPTCPTRPVQAPSAAHPTVSQSAVVGRAAPLRAGAVGIWWV